MASTRKAVAKPPLRSSEIQSKVEREHLIPRQIRIESLVSTLTIADKPTPKQPKGSQKYRDVMKKIDGIRRLQSQIEKALVSKVKALSSKGK